MVQATVDVVFVGAQGDRHALKVPVGTTLMRAAVEGGVSGVLAVCGGTCTCGTCHVYVEFSQQALAPPSDDESAMLEFVIAPRENSRLACQIQVSDGMGELLVSVPESQT